MHKLAQEFFVTSLQNSQTALDYLHNKRHLDDKLISEIKFEIELNNGTIITIDDLSEGEKKNLLI